MSFKQLIAASFLAALSPFVFVTLVQFIIYVMTDEFHAFHLFN